MKAGPDHEGGDVHREQEHQEQALEQDIQCWAVMQVLIQICFCLGHVAQDIPQPIHDTRHEGGEDGHDAPHLVLLVAHHPAEAHISLVQVLNYQIWQVNLQVWGIEEALHKKLLQEIVHLGNPNPEHSEAIEPIRDSVKMIEGEVEYQDANNCQMIILE